MKTISEMTIAELRTLLLTCDASGKQVKEEALDELMNREFRRGYSEGEVGGDV